MSNLKIYKVVAVLPSVLEADTLYMVRTGIGFDMYLTENTGTVAYKSNSNSSGTIIATISQDLGYPAKQSGTFLITGLSGLTVGKQVVISQFADDNLEMDSINCSGQVIDAATIKVFYNSRFPVGGIYQFNYLIQ